MADKFLTDEEKALFHEHMREVKPLHQQKKEKVLSTKPVSNFVKKHSPKIKPKTTAIQHLSDYIQEAIFSETVLSYCHSQVSHQRFANLKNGKIPWEGRLDLHGLSVEPARNALSHFIKVSYQNHKKCLLIIHGKGDYHTSPPVIKNLVHRWLPQFEEVLAYHSARPKDGGTGALYLLLKKNPLL